MSNLDHSESLPRKGAGLPVETETLPQRNWKPDTGLSFGLSDTGPTPGKDRFSKQRSQNGG